MKELFKGYIVYCGKYFIVHADEYNRGTYVRDHLKIGLPTDEYVTVYQHSALGRARDEYEVRTLLIDHLKDLYLIGELNSYTLNTKKFYEKYRRLDNSVTDQEFEDFKSWIDFQFIGKIDKSKLRDDINNIFVRDTIYTKVAIPENYHFK
jgi:hypothetical protein